MVGASDEAVGRFSNGDGCLDGSMLKIWGGYNVNTFFVEKRDLLNPRNYYKTIKHYYQRCRYGVSFVDEWSLDGHIANILIHSLPKYKNEGGCDWSLSVLDEDAHLQFVENGKRNDKALKKAYKRYDAMVDSIVDGLKTMDTSYHDEAASDAFELYGKYARRFWW